MMDPMHAEISLIRLGALGFDGPEPANHQTFLNESQPNPKMV